MKLPLVEIKEACHENWDQMTANEKGRHCAKCQKTVHEVGGMSELRILEEYQKNDGSLCIRIPESRLEPKPVNFSIGRWSLAMAFAAWLMLKSTFSRAQNVVQTKDSIDIDSNILHRDIKVTGQIFDSTSGYNPVAFAQVVVSYNNRVIAGSYSDINGLFQMNIESVSMGADDSLMLKVSMIGMEDLEKPFHPKQNTDSLIFIEDRSVRMDTITIRTSIDQKIIQGISIGGNMMGAVRRVSTYSFDMYDTKTYTSRDIEHSNFRTD